MSLPFRDRVRLERSRGPYEGDYHVPGVFSDPHGGCKKGIAGICFYDNRPLKSLTCRL